VACDDTRLLEKNVMPASPDAELNGGGDRVLWKQRRASSVSQLSDFSDEWVVLAHPEPGDIVQGELGTCWFLSALAVLANRRNLVESLFVSREYNEFGVYQVGFQLVHIVFTLMCLFIDSALQRWRMEDCHGR
jgi:hypothetical protein